MLPGPPVPVVPHAAAVRCCNEPQPLVALADRILRAQHLR